jgi:hypothetical protein
VIAVAAVASFQLFNMARPTCESLQYPSVAARPMDRDQAGRFLLRAPQPLLDQGDLQSSRYVRRMEPTWLRRIRCRVGCDSFIRVNGVVVQNRDDGYGIRHCPAHGNHCWRRRYLIVGRTLDLTHERALVEVLDAPAGLTALFGGTR